jgi:hypothetical protein
MDNNGRPNHIEDYLVQLHTGQWFGWSDSKNKVYANLIIHDGSKSKPSESDCTNGLATMQSDWDNENKSYKLNRLNEYPNHNDCIHALLDGGDTLTDLQAKRQATKLKYPKS